MVSLKQRNDDGRSLACSAAADAIKQLPATGTVIMSNPGKPERRSAELVSPVDEIASVEVDVSSLMPGTSVVVQWRRKPVVVRHRTRQEMEDGEAVSLSILKDMIARNANLPADAPATDANCTTPGQRAWLVMVQVCTHLGCITVGQDSDFGGWLCPCHGSQNDAAGRIRKGPAPENMAVPVFQFISDTKIRIG